MAGGEFEPLSSYGLVGNLETCALVSTTGSVDWAPLPELASPSVFTALLDADKGGQFALRPAGTFDATQRYRPATNVLETTFETPTGTLSVTDFMPVLSDDPEAPFAEPWLFRKVTCEAGAVDLAVDF